MILGQLGRSDAAAPLVAAVNEQRPDFASLAREEVGFWNFDQDAIEHIVEGWRKAGLAIDD